MKTARSELQAVIDYVSRLAMAFPNVFFTLSDGSKSLLKLPGFSGEHATVQRLSDLLDAHFKDNVLAIDVTRDGLHLHGYISLPTYNKATTVDQYLFVNQRPVKDKLLYGAIRGAYQDFISHDRHPVVVLFLDMPYELVDVNVHPAKTEVRFQDPQLIRGMIVSGIKSALHQAGHRAATTGGVDTLSAMRPGENAPPAFTNNQGLGGSYASGGYSGGGYGGRSAHAMPLLAETQAPFGAYEPNALLDLPPQSRVQDVPDSNHDQYAGYPLGSACGQIHETYIVSQTHDGIVIVDQHAAHERLLYERMKNVLSGQKQPSQPLLLPEVVTLGAKKADLLTAAHEELALLGFVIEPFGPGTVLIREVPALLGKADPIKLTHDLADEIAAYGESFKLQEKLANVCGTMACHSAIRAGRKLSIVEMNALLRQMENTPHSGQCNHGRPTYVELKLNDVERLFGRK